MYVLLFDIIERLALIKRQSSVKNMTELHLITLGGVRVLMNGRDITADLPVKIIALLIYLARHKMPKSREHLAELLWPDRTAKQAYGSLRTAISKSKPFLGDILHTNYHEIGIHAWLDANRFEELLQTPNTVGEALSLYQGDFMASFFTSDAREYEDWQLRETEKLSEQFMQATVSYIGVLQGLSRPKEAIVLARHALGMSPLREDLQRALILLYHAAGDRVSALRQYDVYRSLLWEELGLEPDASLQALQKQLEQSPLIPTITEYPLPTRLTSFVGRAESLHQLDRLIRDNRLITISATGGAGKTRLAIEMAYRHRENFRDGVYFVDLSEITHADHVLPTIAKALGLPDDTNPLAQTTIYLQNREMLFICDNFEHVIDASNVIGHWLNHAPQVVFLITSREPLKLYGECVYELQSLSLQESYQLFYERLRAIHADFYRTEAVDTQIRAICQRLDGLPLAIELAAIRARTMSLPEIDAGLSHRLNLLKSDLRNMPRRQRTIFATIEWSYSLLTPAQRTLFHRLSVFRGGWTHEATRFLSPDADELIPLVEKNLVRRLFTGTHRYTMLEPIREYAYYQLEKSGKCADAQNAHAQWLMTFAEETERLLRTSAHYTITTRVREEEENIRVALDYLANQPDQLETYARTISALSWVWNFMRVVNLPFHHAQQAIAKAEHLPIHIRASLLVGGGHSADGLGYHDLAEEWQREGLRLYEALGDMTNVHYTRFFLTGRMTNLEEAIAWLYKLRKIALQTEDDYLFSIVNVNLGVSLLQVSQIQQSKIVLEEGLSVSERHNYGLFIPIYYINLANANYANGNLETSFKLLEQSYVISQNDGNLFNEALSLLELCELCFAIGRIDDLIAYLRQSERLVKDLNLPFVTLRFYFWRGVLASNHGNIPQFYTAYTQVFRNIHLDNGNMLSYIVNSLLYLIYFMSKRGVFLEECATLIGGLDTYRNQLHMSYWSFQKDWYEQTLEALDNKYADHYVQGKSLPITAVLENAQGLLDKLLQ
jgi:predicted ATPase/DNA-binding SARP family transcriptional activator